MRKLILFVVLSLLVLPILTSAAVPVPGCMESGALNYNSLATVDDGSCEYAGGQPFFGKLLFPVSQYSSNTNFATRVAGYIWVGQLVSMESNVTFGVAITPNNVIAEYQSNGNVYHSMMLTGNYNASYVVVTAVSGNQSIRTILPIR